MQPNQKRRKKRKVNYIRLGALACAGLITLSGIGYGAYAAAHHFFGRKNEPILLENGEELRRVDLYTLKPEIQDVIDLKNLHTLKTEIQTYMFNNQLSDLKEEINSYLKDNNIDPTKISWAVQDLSTNAYTESDNSQTNFTAASTYKLPLTMLWYEKVQDGSASMSDTFQLTEKMLEKEDEENPDQPIGRKYKIGDRIPLSELLEAAALYSDNIAGHILFENLGGYSNFKKEALKYSDTLQDKQFTSNENVLNTHYTMNLVNYLYNHPDAFGDLKFWLYAAAQNFFLNKNYPYGYIQKIGNNEEVRNAIGLMNGPFPYSVSVYSCIDAKEGEVVIGDIGEICYNYFQNKYNSGFYDESQLEAKAAKGAMNVQTATLSPYASSDFTGTSIAEMEERQKLEEEQKQEEQPTIQDPAAEEAPEDVQQPAEEPAPDQTEEPQPEEDPAAQNDEPAEPAE